MRYFLKTALTIMLACFFLASCATKPATKKQKGAEEVVPEMGMEEEGTTEKGKLVESELEGKQWQEPSQKIGSEVQTYFKDIHFDFDDFSLKPEAKDTLRNLAEWLLNNPSVYLLIEGHCDERGTNEYNLALGERRANSAKKYLVQLGVSAKRISTISYGEEKPLDPRHNEEAWAKNRRDHFLTR